MQQEDIQLNESYNATVQPVYSPEEVYDVIQARDSHNQDSPVSKKPASHSRVRLLLWSFTCGTMVVAVLALVATVVAVILSMTFGRDYRSQDVQTLQIQLDNSSQALVSKMDTIQLEIQQELHSLIDRLDLIQNGET